MAIERQNIADKEYLVKTDSKVITEKTVDYAAQGDKTEQKAAFTAAVNELAASNLGTAPSRKVIGVITKLFKADDALNQPHTLLIHQRSKLLFELLSAYAKELETKKCWQIVKKMAVLYPYAKEIPNLIEAVANSMRTQAATNIVLLISCQPRVTIALKTREKMREALGSNFKIIIVLGQRDEKLHRPQLHEDILVVDANDNYESLPSKVSKAFEFIYSNFGASTNCYKIDEDLPIHDSIKFKNLMTELSKSEINYAGFVGNNKEYCERTWHFGKCENLEITRRPLGKKFPGPYAYGPLYYLSSRALKSFVIEAIRFPDEILGHLYEDWYVGETLRETGITVTGLSPTEWTPCIGEHWWTINRFWQEPEYEIFKTERYPITH